MIFTAEFHKQEDGDLKDRKLRNIIVTKGNKSFMISVTSVMIFFYENRNVFLIDNNNEILLCDMNMSQITKVIGNRFFRINRQVIINIDAIDFFSYEANHTILIHPYTMYPGLNLTVSKNNVAKFKEWVSYG